MESRQRSEIEDPIGAFYLHHSDSPGTVLVSQLLNGDNYTSWSRSMKIALSVKNKLGFVDGTILKPEIENAALYNAWNRNNNIVLAWILNSVSKEISSSIIFGESAFEVWKDLEERFQQSNGPRIFQLRRELINMVQDQKPVVHYFTKLKGVWEELSNFRPNCTCGKCTCGGIKELNAFHQSEYVMQFLMGLNESFTHARGQVLLMDPIPPINKVFSMVSQEEKQRAIGIEMVSNTDPSSSMAMAVGDQVKKQVKKDRPLCTHCKMLGHTIDKCYKIHDYPPGHKSRFKDQVNTAEGTNADSQAIDNLSDEQCHKLIQMLSNKLSSTDDKGKSGDVNMATFTAGSLKFIANLTNSTYDRDLWIIDYGASWHICSDRSLFPCLIIMLLLSSIVVILGLMMIFS